MKARQIELNLDGVEAALGQGLVVGVLGGFRTIVADFLWLQLNQHWEQRDRVKVDALARLVTTLDPRPDFLDQCGADSGLRCAKLADPGGGGYQVVSEAQQRALDP